MNRAAVLREERLIGGPAGQLEAVLEYSREAAPRARAVVCHPHPLYQGTLNNKVAFTLARAAVEAGAETLRFNFRGVGKSEGKFDDGRGELHDLQAAERWLAARHPHLPSWRMGFSFGAAMALRASVESPCDVLVTVAPPAGRFAEYGLQGAQPRSRRWLLIQGDADEIVDAQAVLRWAHELTPGPEVAVLRGAGHFFHGRLTELRRIVLEFLQQSGGKESL